MSSPLKLSLKPSRLIYLVLALLALVLFILSFYLFELLAVYVIGDYSTLVGLTLALLTTVVAFGFYCHQNLGEQGISAFCFDEGRDCLTVDLACGRAIRVVAIEAAFIQAYFISMRLTLEGGGIRDVLVLKDQMPESDYRRLCVMANWLPRQLRAALRSEGARDELLL